MAYDFRITIACGLSALLISSGCGSSNGLTAVSGTVIYEGQPVQKGSINFLPVNGNGPTAAAVVTDGKYSVKAAPGKKRIQIERFIVIGQRRYNTDDPKSPMIDIQEQTLPARYNTKTELTCEITPSVRTYDFTLKK